MPTLVMVSKKRPKPGLSKVETWVRNVFVFGYVAFTVAMFAGLEFEVGAQVVSVPRLFWTVGVPLVPIGVVIAGFYPWRKVCPLAFWASLGRKLDGLGSGRSSAKQGAPKSATKPKTKPKTTRRVPKWAEAWYPLISLGMLALALCGRLLLTNGDGIALGTLMVVLGFGAALVNWRYTGKTWCNFVCPVSIVERIYTEPNSLRLEHNSQCAKCTACKKNCPDIDQENAYWKGVDDRAKRIAYFSFPGLVLAFYVYFWLRAGDWEAYFGGGWTHRPASLELFAGPGWFFAPAVPAWAAAPLSLGLFMAASFALFSAVEGLGARWSSDPEQHRHHMFTLAAFVAFNVFYIFAGAPSLRAIPYGPRVLAFAVPAVATMFLVKRWRRSRKDYVEEKSAKKLLQKWKFKEPPPADPAGVFAYFKATQAAEEQQLAVYRESVREAYADGIVTKSELKMLELLRTQLGISEGKHRELMEAVAAETTRVVSVEEELQLAGYREALTEAMLQGASEQVLRKLRREYAVDSSTHARIDAELKGDRSPMLARASEGLDQIAHLRDTYSKPLAPLRAAGSFDLALFAVDRMQARALDRTLEALPHTVSSARQGKAIRDATHGLGLGDARQRERTLNELLELIDPSLRPRLAEVIREPLPQAPSDGAPDSAGFDAAIEALLRAGDPYLRAGAIQGVAHLGLERFSAQVTQAVHDEDPLVRETAVYASLRAPGLVSVQTLDDLLRDDDPHIRRAAREALEALAERSPDAPTRSNPIRVIEGRTLPPIPDGAFTSLATADKLLFLRCVPLFEKLNPEDLHEICHLARERTIPDTGLICKQGQSTDDLYLIIEGSAVVTVATPRTSLVLPTDLASAASREAVDALGQTPRGEREVALIGPGDVVGELSAIDQSPRSASVRPKGGPVRLLEIRGEDFRRKVVPRQDVAPKLMATLALRLRETLARVR